MNEHRGQGYTTLAQRLNHLANAHNDRLINDEQYRNLRQAAFEQASQPSNVAVTSTSQLLTAEPQPQRPQHPSRVGDTDGPRALHFNPPPPKPLRSKSSFTSGLASLIRKPTTRRATSEPADAAKKHAAPRTSEYSRSHSPAPKLDGLQGASTSPGGGHPPSSLKLNWTASFSRVLTSKSSRSSLKSSAAVPSKPDHARNPSMSSERTKHSRQFSTSSRAPPPLSFSASTAASSPPTSPIGADPSASVILSSAFLDTGDLHTSQALKEAIVALESEAKRLIASFNELERTKMAQARKKFQEEADPEPHDDSKVLLSPASSSSATLPYPRSQSPEHARPGATQLLVRRAASSAVSMVLSDTGSTRSLHTADHSVHSRTHSVLGRERGESNASHGSSLHKASLSYTPNADGQATTSSGSLSPPSTPSRPSFSSSIASSSVAHASTAPSSVSSHGHGHARNKKSSSSFLLLPPANTSSNSSSTPLPTRSHQNSTSISSAGSSARAPKRRPSLLKSRSAGSLSTFPNPHASSLSALVEESTSFSGGTKSDDVETELERLGETGEEVREVRRQRAEVVKKADDRLAYLRARLKSAELHEKLMRR
ncbi:hypothetical protein BDV98DRAFT_348348 [Pterulicium gracile]|uniref:Uncharacterized protein n=1 Tax=Pterulicium gracile TaxID=1884261 RepID=A0A5C3QPA0_9AGAR|nr:hypothetical protein BDV98DRAFT_348348 [Pterula gracilis]